MLDYNIMLESFPSLLNALPVTLSIFVSVVFFGLIIAVPTSVIYRLNNKYACALINIYTSVFRGTPALIQVFIIYYGLGQFEAIRDSFLWPILREPYYCIILALGLNAGSYSTKIFIGALDAVPKGPIEGAKALGLSRFSIFRKIEVPLATRIALPAYGNDTILNLKSTSLASTITVMELTGSAKLIVSQTYAPYEVFLSAGIVYLILVYTLIKLFSFIEMRMDRKMGRSPLSKTHKSSLQKKPIDAIIK